jgi:hypothetical protein
MKFISELMTLLEWNPFKKDTYPEHKSNIELLGHYLDGKTFEYDGKPFKINTVSWYSDPGLYKSSPNIKITGDYPSGTPHGNEKFLDKIRAFLPRGIQIEYSDYGMQTGHKMNISHLVDPSSPEYEMIKQRAAKVKPQFIVNVDMRVK